MKTLDPLLLAPESWRPALTHSGRLSNRTSERELDRIPATVRVADAEGPVKLWDFSPGGFAVLAPLPGPAFPAVQAGDGLVLRLDLGKVRVSAPCRVVHSVPFRGGLRLGLARTDILPGNAFLAEPSAFALAEPFLASGVVDNPILYGEGCPIRLAAVLPGPRFAFTTDDPTLALFRDQALAVALALQSTGDLTIRGRIRDIAQPSAGEIAFLLYPEAMSPGTLETLGEFLALDRRAQAGTLGALGLPAIIRREGLEFRFAETPAEQEAAYGLRAGLPPASLWVSGDDAAGGGPRDPSSRILCAYHEGRLAAAIGLEFPEGGDGPAMEGGGAVLVRTVAVPPEFRRADLLLQLAARLGRAVLLSGRREARWACGGGALPVLLVLGFRPGGAHVVLDRETVLAGRGMASADWLPVFGGLRADLVRKRLLPPGSATPRFAARVLQGLGDGMLRRLGDRIEHRLGRAMAGITEKVE